MKRNFKSLVMFSLIAGSLTLNSCRNGEENKEDAAEPMQNEMREGERMNEDTEIEENIDETTAEFKDETTAMVYQHYIDIKKALVETDAAMAQERAKELVAQLETAEVTEEFAAAARNISSSNDVNKQREAFSNLTAAMETRLEGALASGEIYKQYCPMAFEGKGDYWFSNSQEIRNPYYGDKMLKCGRVEATIN
ncbi:DUF3347 domain-containing protein [Antarcticibacterium sp. 1MA-6-2]|uniref:DUF3347 domain-containing protein n=1 Tax=Antarcticibacterium sp. 1MA-6-2 TaxID=2908210 RepID=UPI001F482759|nr:DUF3347 domain-containing protein [Antarcticibacterium sp. 1MA-6-2]UJH89815.1 DUF3347 domain-containing protein [Antarcticibacterium sp. 1MA-6-2]